MKITMILTNGFNPDIRVYKEAKYCADLGAQLTILCWDRTGDCSTKSEELVDGIKILRFQINSIPGSGLRQLPSFFRFLLVCRQFIAHNACDYLHCHDIDGMIAGYFANICKAKMVFDMHEWWETKSPRNYHMRHLIRFSINYLQKRCAAVIYVDSSQREHIKPANLEKYKYLPNYPQRDLTLSETKTKSDSLRFAYIGYVRSSGTFYSNIFDAASRFPQMTLLLHGGGTSCELARRLAEDYHNVVVTGQYDGLRDSARLYQDTDICCCIYDQKFAETDDNFCVKFYEAIAAATPLLVNRNTRMAAFLEEHQIGYSCNTDDIDDVIKTFSYILSNLHELPEIRQRMLNIRDDFCWESVVPVLESIYFQGSELR